MGDLNNTESTMSQICNIVAKTVLRGKFIALNEMHKNNKTLSKCQKKNLKITVK
jgi:hypothetical protein